MDLVPSPAARTLLDLRRTAFDGEVSVAGRVLRLTEGAVTDVSPGDGDPSLAGFLVRAGAISEEEAASVSREGRDSLVLSARPQLASGALQRATRACWVERLSRAMDQVHGEVQYRPAAHRPQHLPASEPLVPLLLDALSRIAAEHDAGVVGARGKCFVSFTGDVPTEVLEEAKRWSGLREQELAHPLTQLLVRHPGAASRIAALVRAGFARLASNSDPPAPPARPSGWAPPARASVAPPGSGSAQPVEPGGTLELPRATATLDDPLVPVEREIAHLEQIGASGEQRAAAWKRAAQLWQRRHGSLEEAARAYREAAAASPRDRDALRQATALCAATGRLRLARAYAQAHTAACPLESRGVALLEEARLAERAGDTDAAVALLRQAGSQTDDPALWEHLARLLGATDRWWDRREAPPEEATEALGEAARALRASEPARSRNLLMWLARPEMPDFAAHVRALGTALFEDGYPEAAIHHLGEAAHHTPHVDERRLLRMEAAERAEEIERPDLAAALLLDAHLEEPSLEVLYLPLVADLESAGWPGRHAVLLERIGVVATEDGGRWWGVAAAYFERLGSPWARELRIRALCKQPELIHEEEGPLVALREYAEQTGDHATYADALERVSRAAEGEADLDAALLALRTLAPIVEERLGSTPRALWAWQRMVELRPDAHANAEVVRLARKVRLKLELTERARQEYEQAPPGLRPLAARKLATLLRDQPEQRPQAIALYREAVAADPEDRAAARSLERLLRLSGDESAWTALVQARAKLASTAPERIRAAAEASGLAFLRSDWTACINACEAWLGDAPETPEAVARLEIAARLQGDPAAQRRAWDARIALPRERSHARAHVARARDRWARGGGNAAAAVAADIDQALALDSRSAEAFAFAERWAPELLTAAEALRVLDRGRRVLGDHWLLLRTLRRLAEEVDPARCAALLNASLRLAPNDAELAAERIRVMAREQDLEGLRSAVESALRHPRPPLRPLSDAVDALAAQSEEEAARLALRIVDATGTQQLLEKAARHAQSAETRIAVCERRAAFEGEQGVAALRALAVLHRERSDRAAEARSLLRVLQFASHDASATTRLAELYAETGEDDRLMAVLALRLEGAALPRHRKVALFDLAVAAFGRLDDIERGEAFLDQWVEESRAEEALEGGREGGRDAAREARDAAQVLLRCRRPSAAASFLLRRASSEADGARAAWLTDEAVSLAEEHCPPDVALRVAAQGLRGRHGPSALLVFERLALSARAVDLAIETYEHLVGDAMGRHGRRGTLYRQARWLERAEQADLAMDAYLAAFEEAPSEGVVFSAIDRLGRQTGRFEPVAAAFETLANQQSHVDRRIALERGAVAVIDGELDDPMRAFERLAEAWRNTGRSALMQELRRLGHRAAARDATATPWETLLSGLRTRIEQTWDVPEQIRTLSLIASVHAEDQGDLSAAGRVLFEEMLRKAQDEPEEAPVGLVADAFVQLARWRADAGDLPGAQEAARTALDFDPRHEAGLAFFRTSSAPPRGSDTEKRRAADATLGEGPDTAERPFDPTTLDPPLTEVATVPEESDPARFDPMSLDAPAFAEDEAEDAAPDERDAASAPKRRANRHGTDPLFPIPMERSTGEHRPWVSDETDAGERLPWGSEDTTPRGRAWPGATDGTGEESAKGPNAAADAPEHVDGWEAAPSPFGPSPSAPPGPPPSSSPPRANAEAPTGTQPLARLALKKVTNTATAPSSVPARPPVAAELTGWRSSPPPSYDPVERELKERARLGDVEAMAELGTRLGERPERRREAQQLLLRAFRTEPWRLDALDTLAAISAETPNLGDAVAEIRGVYQGLAPDIGSTLGGWGGWGEPLGPLLRPRAAPLLEALGTVWSSANPLFRRSFGEFGVVGTQRLTALMPRPFAEDYALARQILDVGDVAVYVRQGGSGFRWAPTEPPALIVSEAEEEQPSRRFRFARALELSRPPHILLVSRPASEVRVIIEALHAAFGPPEAIGEVPREAASLAADLWRTIPARDQGRLRELLGAHAGRPAYADALAAAMRAGVRAGYLVDGNLGRAIVGLAQDESALEEDVLRTRDGFASTVRSCEPLASLLRIVLSDAALAARAHARRHPLER